MKTFATALAPHISTPRRVQRVMAEVLLALLPGAALQLWTYGPGHAFQLVLALVFGLALETALSRLRPAPLNPAGDFSAAVTAALFALSLAPLAPWWVSAFGMFVALGVAKHAYGGLGANLFNPAMVGCAFVLVAFPHAATTWPAYTLGLAETAGAIFLAGPGITWDTLSSATPLDVARQLGAQGLRMPEIYSSPLYADSRAGAGPWIALAYTLGGLYLLWRRIIGWQAPVGVIAGTVLMTLPFWLLDAERHASPLQQLGSGGLMLAAWFVATDPVSGCTSPRGRLIFGAGVAVLTLIIRRWGTFPDGVAFAVLLMNALAPLIDRATRPRIYGRNHA
ncbi:MAG: RnfABCDGE type electron transport complex subunit D [Rhodanobacteraceae bacterium]|nr:RnfABCDGE type electron transport complex subunit D [Rhodanobacteraceae bacterium]